MRNATWRKTEFFGDSAYVMLRQGLTLTIVHDRPARAWTLKVQTNHDQAFICDGGAIVADNRTQIEAAAYAYANAYSQTKDRAEADLAASDAIYSIAAE